MRNSAIQTRVIGIRDYSLICQIKTNDCGAALVEFALVLPVFLIIVLGIISFGIYLGAIHGTAQLAADAARASVAGLSDTERAAIAQQQVATNVHSYFILDPAKVTVSAAPLPADTTEFQVTVKYDASALPIWGFTKFVSLPSQTIVRSATIKRGGY